ncbi:nitroreductase [Bacillus canaveralius]|uniref:Putative NAD(P)H nitroreductase n=1 Tax=Bacillus canaveralius TaxID=1403243 RepID=A0A2N5GMT8_9BACI|nr:nitroreductase [Bacillus canaveralius]PLR83291.1 nitroreductase [Bacillus canaveralius]PLR96662.1 nitroreductase [Bacillus canaveralius]
MDVLEAIKTRRSFGLVKDEAVPEADIERILEAGTWAPNHHRTEPWRFFVMTGEGRKQLGDVLLKITRNNGETDSKKLEKVQEKPFRAPAIIAVAVEPSDNPKAIDVEEYGAVYACIQNMLLAAHSLGLAGVWRTGKPTYDPLMKQFFGLSEKGEVLGFLYLGYPLASPPEGKRKPFMPVTKWIK